MKKKIKEVITKPSPDYISYDSFISDYIESTPAEQLQAVSDGSIKFNIGKTEAKKLLGEKIKILETQRKEESNRILEEQKAKIKEEKEKAKQILEEQIIKTRQEKEKARQILEEQIIKTRQEKEKARQILEEKKGKEQQEKEKQKLIKAEQKAEQEKAKEIKRQEKELDRQIKKDEAEAEKKQKQLLLDELEETWDVCNDDLFQVVCEEDWRKAKYYFVKRLMKENSYLKVGNSFCGEMSVEDFEKKENVICGIKTFKDNQDIILYSQEEGVYIQNADIFLSAESERRFGEKATNMQIREIIESIKRRTYYDREELENQPKNLRPVGNGLWDIVGKELSEFTPEHVYLNKINIPHISTAQCPKFKKFLTQILDGEKEFLVIQEWMGYCLLNDVRFAKALLLFGDGENGKSILLHVIKHFLGEGNVTSISLQYLEKSPFAPVRLFGKIANIFADLPKKALSQTSVFKMVVSGDSITGEKKGKDSFEFTPYIKMMFSCNEPPRTPDRTRGFFRRWLILKFNQHFPEGDVRRDENLFDKLKDSSEMEGILQFALEGLYRLLTQKRFTENMTRTEIEDFWLRHSDSVSAFVLDLIDKNIYGEETKNNVFQRYEEYCNLLGYPTEEQNQFWNRFKDIVEYTEYFPKNKFGTQIKAIKGVTLKSINSISKMNGGNIL